MIDLSPLAVPHTLRRLYPVLPAAPARVLEVGCGRGALAAELAAQGYQVSGVEPDEAAREIAERNGVAVLPFGVLDVPETQRCDVLLFTRSLHHIEHLDESVEHALRLVEPGGLVVLEEFARERADRAAAGFLHDTRALLASMGVLEHPEHGEPIDPSDDPLGRWEREVGAASESPLHTGEQMLAALLSAGARDLTREHTETLWRMVVPPRCSWLSDPEQAKAVVRWARQVECRRIGDGSLPPIGMFVTARVS